MGTQTEEPKYTGMDRYPGIISIAVTIVVGAIFLGALYNSATSGHHGDDHGAAHGDDHGEDHAAEDDH